MSDRAPRTRIAFYTSGGVGGGHLTRALAIRRALERRGEPADFRVFHLGPPRFEAPLDVVVVPNTPADLATPDRAAASDLARSLMEFRPDVVLVDFCWRDVTHVLPGLSTTAWLLLRWCPRDWLGGPLNRAFRPHQYERIVAIEPIVPVETTHRVEPVVACNPEECLPTSALRERYGVPEGRGLTLVAQAGAPGEADRLVQYERELETGHAIVVADGGPASPVPLAPWLPGADRIVGGAGYNLFWETRWLGLGARAELFPFRRTMDDQTPRVRRAAGHRMTENGADRLAAWLAAG